MNPEPDSDARDGPLESLLAEAQEAVAYSANALRSVRDRFRDAHLEQVAYWERLRDEVATASGRATGPARTPEPPRTQETLRATAPPLGPEPAWSAEPARSDEPARTDDAAPGDGSGAAAAAEAGAEDARVRTLNRDEAITARLVGAEQSAMARIELAIKSLESAWLFLGQDDHSLVADTAGTLTPTDIQMRIVEAQEAERTRLAREVHDGPAQALSNAVFQVEVVERMLAREPVLAAAELRLHRELLRRELGDVRAFISQLRPPILADLGLEGAIRESADLVQSILGVPVDVEVDAEIRELGDTVETVILRIVQEALHNVRKHSDARRVVIRCALEDGHWVVEVRDDGRGFDVGAVAARGRRNFGLQFMRERAELIGAEFEVRSRSDGGTVVRISIPRGAEETR